MTSPFTGQCAQERSLPMENSKTKRAIVARDRTGDVTIPAGWARPVGCLHWLIDRTAASAECALQ